MAKKFAQPYSQDVTKYAVEIFLITPDDANDLPFITRAISFSAAGAISVVTHDGTSIVIPSGSLAAGVLHPIGLKRILATGTTAADIVGYV